MRRIGPLLEARHICVIVCAGAEVQLVRQAHAADHDIQRGNGCRNQDHQIDDQRFMRLFLHNDAPFKPCLKRNIRKREEPAGKREVNDCKSQYDVEELSNDVEDEGFAAGHLFGNGLEVGVQTD